MNKTFLFILVLTIILEIIIIYWGKISPHANIITALGTICSAIFVGWQALESRKANKETIEFNQETATQNTKIALYKERKEFLEKLKEAKKVHIEEVRNALKENPIYKNILTLKSFFSKILEEPRNQETVEWREELRELREAKDKEFRESIRTIERQKTQIDEFMYSAMMNELKVFFSVSNESEMLFSKEDLTKLMAFFEEMRKVHSVCFNIYFKICTEIDAIIDSIISFIRIFDGRSFGESYLNNEIMNKKEEELVKNLMLKCIDIERKFVVMFKLLTLEHEAKDRLFSRNEAQYKELAMKISFDEVMKGLQEITKPF